MNDRFLTQFKYVFTILLVILTTLPYFLNWLLTPSGYHYTWILFPYPQDSLSYMAWSQQAAQGNFLFKLKYTAQPHSPFLFHPFFLVCGGLVKLTHWHVGIVHLILKIFGVMLFSLILFRYLAYLRLSRFEVVLSALLVGFSSGFGWYLKSISGIEMRTPIFWADLWIVDANTFWSLLWNPLFPYSLTLVVASIFLLDRGTALQRPADGWLCGLCVMLISMIHPYHVALVTGLVILVSFVRRKNGPLPFLVRCLPLCLFALGYLFLLSQTDPIIAQHSLKGEMRSPSPLVYLVGSGIPGLLFLWALQRNHRQFFRFSLLLIWIAAAYTMAYLPFWFQRKSIFGTHAAICILASVAIGYLLSQRTRRTRLICVALIFLASIPTNVHVLAKQYKETRNDTQMQYYVPDDIWSAMRFLSANTDPDEVVYSDEEVSQLIPAFAGNTVVWGHWAMSVDKLQRDEWDNHIFGSTMDERQRRDKFWAGVSYALIRQEMKSAFTDDGRLLLEGAKKIFDNGSVEIFKRRQEEKS